jgi:general secretion pathway protein M
MNQLRAWYAGLQAREQRMVAVGGVLLALIILVGGILMPLQSATSRAVDHTKQQRDDLAWMRANSAEIRAAAGQMVVDTGEAPLVLVDRTGRMAGLTDALRGTQPSGTGVRVQLEGASFDSLVTWLANLDQNYGLGVDSITLDRAAKPGLVNANITFSRSKP